jgi:hypothetical protein
MWGDVFPRCGDVVWGDVMMMENPSHRDMTGCMEYFAWLCAICLYQAQFSCPFDSPPAAIDIEFAVNALGVCTNRT